MRLCVCVCLFTCVCVSVSMSLRVCVFMCVQSSRLYVFLVFTFVCFLFCMYTCLQSSCYVCIHVCVSVCMHICVYVCLSVCLSAFNSLLPVCSLHVTYVYVHTNIYTYTERDVSERDIERHVYSSQKCVHTYICLKHMLIHTERYV